MTESDLWSVSHGAARPIAKAFLVVHLLFTFAFIAAGRGATRRTAGGLS